MSLRTRLVLALGVVALVALVAADVATYSALRSFLVQRVDQQLQQADSALARGPGPDAHHGDGSPFEPDHNRALPGGYVELRDAQGNPLFTPQEANIAPYRTAKPVVPKKITLGDSGERYMTVSATSAGGPQFRVRVSTTASGDQLILGLPLNGVTGT